MEEIILKEFETILSTKVGTQFVKANLHIHTPASTDWNSETNQTHRAEDVTPDDIVRAAADAELGLIAITDHNTVKWCRPVIEAANKLRKQTGYDLVVLPGVEISTYEGVHLQAIFDPHYPVGELDTWIKNLGLQGTGTPKESTTDQIPLSKILEWVHEADGVVVVPHAKSRNGMLNYQKGSAKVEWLNSGMIDLMAINECDTRYLEEQDRYVINGMDTKAIRARFAFINVSDSHRLEDMGEGATWLALGERNAQGLRQLLCEPRTRISRTTPDLQQSDAVLGVAVDGGYFDGQFIRFSDRFSAIIGGNHSGKSSLFDFIRFAYGDLPAEDRIQRYYNRLRGILQRNGCVRLYYRFRGEYYVSKRILLYEADAIEDRIHRLTSQPEVYRFVDGRLELVRQPLQFRVEMYEQGDVGKIREHTNKQLEVLDRYAGIDFISKKYEIAQRELELNSRSLAPLFGQIDELEQEVGRLPELERTKTEIESQLQEAVFREESKWNTEEEYLVRVRELVEKQRARVQDTAQTAAMTTPIPERKDVVHPEILSEVAQVVQLYSGKFVELAQQDQGLVAEFRAALEPHFEALREKHRERANHLRETLQRLKVPSKENLVERNRQLDIEIGKIKHTVIPGLEKARHALVLLEGKRVELLATYRSIREEINATRVEKSQELSRTLGDAISLELRGYKDRREYFALLLEIYNAISSQEMKIRNKDEQLNLVCRHIDPWDLARFISEGNRAAIVENAPGVTENTANALLQVSHAPTLLHKIQVVEVYDEPQILVRRVGESGLTPLGDLSGGEQSAAILALTMINTDIPLLIDQPEEELHYSYVTQNLVKGILGTKSCRQMILITLNPNIPVLGDAELVVHLKNDVHKKWGRQCYSDTSGAFEAPEVINRLYEMEGGENAFKRRHHRYTGEQIV